MTEYTANQHGEVIKSNEYISLTAHRRIVDKLEKRIKELEEKLSSNCNNKEGGIIVEELSTFSFTKYNKAIYMEEIEACMVYFVPKNTSKTKELITRWISYPKGKAPKTKEEFERIVGMSVLSVE